MKKPNIITSLVPLKKLSALPVRKKIYIVFLLLLVIILLIPIYAHYLPPAYDWTEVFRPATLALVNGRSPYEIKNYVNPPWALIPFIPLLLFPENVGRAILALSTIAALTYLTYRLGAKPLAILFFLLSPPVIQMILDGAVDWLVALGFILPPQIGLLFVVIKPQIGIAIVFYWLIQVWRTDGFRKVIQVFLPVSLLTILSFVFFGLWPIKLSLVSEWGGGASLWPVSVPVGLVLLVISIRKQQINYAMAASPCLSPYVILHSWIGPLLAIISSIPELITAVIGLWILVAIRGFGG